MNPQERQVLADLFERIRSAAVAPRDAEAEAFITEAVRAQPYAPYLLAQTALVQQQALDAAAQRIQELEARAQPPQESGFLGNLGRSLFGGGQPAPRPGYDAGAYQRAAAPPPPAAPAYAPPSGPWGAPQPAPRSGGFLAGAMTTATGVAGGLLAVNAIESLLGGGRGGLFGGYGGAGFGGGETVVNNFYDAPNPDAGRVDAALPDAGLDSGGFQDASDYDAGQDGGGFDDGGSGGGGFDV
jgi:hypothetical protein